MNENTDLIIMGTDLGTRNEIVTFGKRIKAMVPGGHKLSDGEAQALAQVSLATRLNPFIGEIWYIPRKGPMVGIKGWKRIAFDKMEEIGGDKAYYHVEFIVISGKEAGARDDEDVSHAFKCIVRDSLSTGKWMEQLQEAMAMLKGSVDDVYGEARKMVGPKPEWIGYGYSTLPEESRMNKMRLAQKRAESMALQERFPVPFGASVAAADDRNEYKETPDWLEGEVSELSSSATSDDQAGEPGKKTWGVPAVEEEEIIDGVNVTKVRADRKKAVQTLSHVSFDVRGRGPIIKTIETAVGGKEERYELIRWIYGDAYVNSQSWPNGIWNSLRTWIAASKDSETGEWIPSPVFIREVSACKRAAARSTGQTEMEL